LGLGNIGHKASFPVMEGKAMLFNRFAGIDAIPLVIKTQDVDEFVATVTQIADSFAAINLEDISAPRCFEIEDRLKKALDIPVMHDDQHGTAVVVLAALINAVALTGKNNHLKIVVTGAGAAGTAIINMLLNFGFSNITMVDSQGIVSQNRTHIHPVKLELAKRTSPQPMEGSLADALQGADAFIGVSRANLLVPEMIGVMNQAPIIIAMANPIPEIMPDLALKAGAAIVATGRSDFPNQVNNALAFPGIFRGAIDARHQIDEQCKLAAAQAIVEYHQKSLTRDNLLPSILDPNLHQHIATAVRSSCRLA
jgi:malate dehydrogenase (oxaloacetate-decarboxylating)